MYTLEQLAIRQFLSKPLPYGGACGCLGAQKIDSKEEDIFELCLDMSDVTAENRLKTISVIRIFLNISIKEAKQELDKGVLAFDYPLWNTSLKPALEKLGVVCTPVEKLSKRYPVCPCSMPWYQEVQGHYYQILEHRSPDGITHTATNVGPVGGPYNIPKYA